MFSFCADVNCDHRVSSDLFPHFRRQYLDYEPDSFYELLGIAATARCRLELPLPFKSELVKADSFRKSSWRLFSGATLELYRQHHKEEECATMSGIKTGDGLNAAAARLAEMKAITEERAASKSGKRKSVEHSALASASASKKARGPRPPRGVASKTVIVEPTDKDVAVVGDPAVKGALVAVGGSPLKDGANQNPQTRKSSRANFTSKSLAKGSKGKQAAVHEDNMFPFPFEEMTGAEFELFLTRVQSAMMFAANRYSSFETKQEDLQAEARKWKSAYDELTGQHADTSKKLQMASEECNKLKVELDNAAASLTAKDAEKEVLSAKVANLESALAKSTSEVVQLNKFNADAFDMFKRVNNELK